jgi:hypothetical protein
MLLTTMGSDYWPRTPEGRLLCLLLAIYAFAVFGYVTAAIAAYFVGQDRSEGPHSLILPPGQSAAYGSQKARCRQPSSQPAHAVVAARAVAHYSVRAIGACSESSRLL